jgi:phosphatidylserine/phosphatidylglycerophosphate/cardiolipin synthase-like enzyme
MDSSTVTQALQSLGVQAFGIAMPQLAQDWVPSGGGTPSYTANDATMALTVQSVNWAAPCTAALLVVNPTKGQPMPVTLINADGSVQTTGVLLTLFEAAWLRLARLYAEVLETASTTRPQQANGLPFRQVPRYFFYPNQTNSQTQGMVDAQANLGFNSCELRIYDNDGLPIDPVAVMSAFNALMKQYQLLQAGTASTSPALGTHLSTLAPTSGIRVRIVNPDGTPYTGTLLTGLTALTTGSSAGISTTTQGTTVQVQAVNSSFTQDNRNRIVFGPSTSGQLTSTFTPPTLPSNITLQRDFYTLRLVQLKAYLLGTMNASDPATQSQQQPDVRINENLTLLTNGNDVLGAIGKALASGATPTLAVAQALDGSFTLPTASGSSAQWPVFPSNSTPDASATLSITLPSSLTITAAYFNSGATDFTKADVILTIAGFPPSTANAWVRVYTRLFGVDATQQRGDGQGRLIPASGGTLSIYLTDPLGLKTPGILASQIVIPPSATLSFDMVVVLPNQTARIYGGLSANIAPGPKAKPPFAPGTNPSTTASFQGVSNAGVLGLGTPTTATAPTSLLGWVEALTGEGTPRDASRFPTMARRELLVAGLSSSNRTGVIGGGRLAKEAVCNLPRLGEPGGYGGRETGLTGVSSAGGRVAYDIARHALRRAQNIVGRVVTLSGSSWNLPAEPTAVALGQQPSGNSGTFAGALLQNIAPYCESPELHDVLAANPGLIDNAIDSLINNSTILPSSLTNQQDIKNALNSLKSNPPAGTPTPTSTAVLIAQELIRELSSSAFGRRDTQWALANAIAVARHFIYIETPVFCSTADTSTTLTAYAVDLIATLNKRLQTLPGLRLMICVPKKPDFAPGYEGMASYEVQDRYNIVVGNPAATTPIVPQLPTAQTVAFHLIGFPECYSRIESTVIIIDDSWALIGGSSFRRRGLTFDGSSDIVFTDTQVENGRSPTIRDFRRALLAARLGIPTDQEHPSYVQLYDGQQSFQLIRQTLQSGGLGHIDRLWNGQTPHVAPTLTLPIAQSNPDGRDFIAGTAAVVAAIAASGSGW